MHTGLRSDRRRRITSGFFGCAAALLLSAAASAETHTMVCVLTGSQETPAVATNAFGCGVFQVDTAAKTVTYRIAYSGLSSAETAAHIHGFSGIGVPSGVVHPLPAGNPKVGVWNYAAGDEAAILDGRTYVNIHTVNFAGGEIRGQIVDMVAMLDGAQETPPAATPARGVAMFMLDRCANTLNYHIIYGGLTGAETAAHIHGYSLHGTPAGVVHPLPAGNPKVGSWTFNEGEQQRILDGQAYVNIHTTLFAGGEIRGQIVRHVVPIDPAQEVPPSPTTGSGCAHIALNTGTNTLSYEIIHGNMTGAATLAHIHGFAPPGVNAGVLHNIGPATPVVNTWAYGAANAANVLAGLTYINVHTAAFPGGEIRGQINFANGPCNADVNCDGAVDVFDLLDQLNAFGVCGGGAPVICNEDSNGDGSVDVFDLLVTLNNFGPCP